MRNCICMSSYFCQVILHLVVNFVLLNSVNSVKIYSVYCIQFLLRLIFVISFIAEKIISSKNYILRLKLLDYIYEFYDKFSICMSFCFCQVILLFNNEYLDRVNSVKGICM